MTDPLREAAQEALEALRWHYANGHSNTITGMRLKIDEKAIRELSAALAQPEMCACGDRAAEKCPGQWEHGCDLGSNEKYVAVAQPEPVSKAVQTAPAYQCHELKTDAEVFQAVLEGLKTYEIRRNDRGFAVGDMLVLRETEHSGAEMLNGAPLRYTGRSVERRVSHVLAGPIYGLESGWVILSLAQPAPEPVAWVSRTGHGVYYRGSITPALQALEHGGVKMWTPLFTTPPTVAAAVAAERERCANAVPSNWCDPLLTGPQALVRATDDCQMIERLLVAIRDRIRAGREPA